MGEEHSVWTEKYRPHNFSDFRGQKEVLRRIKAFVDQKNIPHLLFSGPAGVGKTTLSLLIAHKLYGEEWKQNFLELNASDERGIDVVRIKVKDFARTRALGDVPFKCIYLDECDALTKDAQQALRRMMENYTQTARFVLSCNYVSKIIDPIQSRCAIFKFRPLDKTEIIAIIESIQKEEGFKIDEDAKEVLVDISGGDCRRVENLLQSCAAFDRHITADSLYAMASIPESKEIKAILELCTQNKFVDARNRLLSLMMSQGLSGLDVIRQIQKEIWNLTITAQKKIDLVDKTGEIEFRMVEGADEFIQLEALLANVVRTNQSL